MFDVLVYVYENYWRPDACPSHDQLSRKLTAVGFETEEIQEALPNALEIRIDPEFAAPVTTSNGDRAVADRSPGELFASYCAERTVEDKRVQALFARLHDEETSGV